MDVTLSLLHVFFIHLSMFSCREGEGHIPGRRGRGGGTSDHLIIHLDPYGLDLRP